MPPANACTSVDCAVRTACRWWGTMRKASKGVRSWRSATVPSGQHAVQSGVCSDPKSRVGRAVGSGSDPEVRVRSSRTITSGSDPEARRAKTKSSNGSATRRSKGASKSRARDDRRGETATRKRIPDWWHSGAATCSSYRTTGGFGGSGQSPLLSPCSGHGSAPRNSVVFLLLADSLTFERGRDTRR